MLNKTPLSCLLYADDIILLSSSAEGLQASLEKLSKYCSQWNLKINYDKTKCLIFNTNGRLLNSKFTINNKVLENVRHYRYLGVTFSASGSFTEAKSELFKRD
jgi:hypothetical protein